MGAQCHTVSFFRTLWYLFLREFLKMVEHDRQEVNEPGITDNGPRDRSVLVKGATVIFEVLFLHVFPIESVDSFLDLLCTDLFDGVTFWKVLLMVIANEESLGSDVRESTRHRFTHWLEHLRDLKEQIHEHMYLVILYVQIVQQR